MFSAFGMDFLFGNGTRIGEVLVDLSSSSFLPNNKESVIPLESP